MSKKASHPLRAIRQERKLTLRDVAEGTGLDEPWLSRVERFLIKDPAYEKVIRLARFFMVSPDQIFPVPMGKGRAA